MKCPKCNREMTKKKAPNNAYYFECSRCLYSIGKPAKGADSDGSKENASNSEKV